jgi:hypothetical protein
MSSINDIIHEVESGLLRPSHYNVTISWTQTLNVLAENITLPGRSLSTLQRRMWGPQRDIPYERLFSGDLEMTLLLTKEWRKYFEEWMDWIIDKESNLLNQEYHKYTGSIIIELENPTTSSVSSSGSGGAGNSPLPGRAPIMFAGGGLSEIPASGQGGGGEKIGFALEVTEAYPKTISPIQLGYEMNNNYIKQNVSFAFREYKLVENSSRSDSGSGQQRAPWLPDLI